jgi:GAF domain-containing protein
VAELFGKIARALAGDDQDRALDKIVHLAVDHLDGCEHAGISLVEHRVVTSGPNTGDVPAVVDRIQNDVGEGPCVDAITEHQLFKTGDLAHESRWPHFAHAAHEATGVQSILSLRLYIDGDTMGALNMYSTKRDAFDDDRDVALAAVFASHAAVAVSSARREDNLERKADSRDVIGQAKGILMTQSHIHDDVAFDLLRQASQRLNVKVVDVARDIVERHEHSN